MQRGASFLARHQKVASGRTVVYRRGTNESAPIIGWVHAYNHEEVGDDGIRTTVFNADWTFKKTDLVIGGQPIEPRRGDVIEEDVDGVVSQYGVLPLDDEKCFRELDPASGGILLLVHAKLVKRVS